MKFSIRTMAALLLCCLVSPGQAKRAPNLALKDLAGHTRKIAELRGSISVINFWATWCGPCREELPLLTKLNAEYGAKKIRFIAVSADENADSGTTRTKIEEFVKANNLAVEVWVGGDLESLDRFGLGNELPASAVLDENGEVISRVMGEAREGDIRTPLDWLLNGRQGAAPAPITKRY